MVILFSTFGANEPKQHQLAAVIVITSSIPGPSSSSSSLRRRTFFNLSINPLFRLCFEINNKNTRLLLRTPRSCRLTVIGDAQEESPPPTGAQLPPCSTAYGRNADNGGKGRRCFPHRDAYHLKKKQVAVTVFFFEGKRFAVSCQILVFLPVWYVLFSSCVLLKLGVA